jgi:hypothetical protein
VVPMKNKVMQFPKPSSKRADVPTDEPHIVFSLGEVRLAIQYKLVQVNYKPAKVISIQKRSRLRGGEAKRKPK